MVQMASALFPVRAAFMYSAAAPISTASARLLQHRHVNAAVVKENLAGEQRAAVGWDVHGLRGFHRFGRLRP